MRNPGEECQAQLARLLESQTLRSSEGLRRLLAYLAERSQSGDADQIKEYTIGVEAFHKPPDYDPREDSTVRIQAGRLRQKLTDYYQGEGKGDLVIAELPKGHFKLTWSRRASAEPVLPPKSDFGRYAGVLGIVACACVVWAIFETAQVHSYRRQLSSSQPSWPPELAELWAPFVDTGRPLYIVESTPMLIKLSDDVLVRDRLANRPEDIATPKVASSLHGFRVDASKTDHRYTNFGNVTATFLIEKLLDARKVEISILNSSETTWRQLSEGNVLFVGASQFFTQQDQIPIEQPLTLETPLGVHNWRPRSGEPSVYRDAVTPDGASGLTYALVSHMPGPLGKGDIESFSCSTAPGIQAAAQWFTSPAGAKALVELLKNPSGKLPRYYQVVLQVKFQDNVPIETSYVVSRELQPRSLYEARSAE